MRRRIALAAAAAVLAAVSLAPAAPWRNLGRDPQHSGRASRPVQPLESIRWSAPVDLAPPYEADGELFIHYGTPLVTSRNTVVFPVKKDAAGSFRVEARRATTGALLWSFDTDYVLPDHGWVPSCGVCLAGGDRVVAPAAGGTLLVRTRPDRADGTPVRSAFFDLTQYTALKDQFDALVKICTPVTSDARGNLYFGFRAAAGAPLALESGFARISASGQGTWTPAAAAAGLDAALDGDPAMNSAPALSRDGRTLYVAVRDSLGTGHLCALNAATLARRSSTTLQDVLLPAEDAQIFDDGTASPTVGPDGDVYFGVVEAASTFNYFRGWLLHFDATLSVSKAPGAFGWDDTPSIVPRSAVPSYQGRSRYLLLTKMNDYASGGGTGVNRLSILDPNDTESDPRTGAVVMREVLTIAGRTPDLEWRDVDHPDAVREWCINTAAIDPRTKSALVNNEDGVLYRWDLRTNTLSQSVVLTPGIGEAYTPTVIGPDGTVYAINDAKLFAVGRAPRVR